MRHRGSRTGKLEDFTELLKNLECIHGFKPENVCADCDKLVKTLTLPEIPLRKTGSIWFSMNLIPFQNNMAQRLLTSYWFLRKRLSLAIGWLPHLQMDINYQATACQGYRDHCQGHSHSRVQRTNLTPPLTDRRRHVVALSSSIHRRPWTSITFQKLT